ncbi:hypothetical protein CAPTEDRAFT_81459, partial [Capitella teleta]
LCGLGLRAVALGMQALKLNDADVVVAGGQECMSKAPHTMHMRNGIKFGDVSLSDSMLNDGLIDAFNNYHMGITAENVAKQWNLSREEQDQFALQSQLKCEAAQKAGHFDTEILPVNVPSRKGPITVSKDEFPRAGSTAEAFQKLRP